MSSLCCPICERIFDHLGATALPFCSDRCRQIDLGRWLKETYTVPVVKQPEDEDACEEAADA